LLFASLRLIEKEVNRLSYPIHSRTSQSREVAKLFVLCVVAPYRETSQSAILSNSLKNFAMTERSKAFFLLFSSSPYQETSQSAILSNSLKNLAMTERSKAFCSLCRCALSRNKSIGYPVQFTQESLKAGKTQSLFSSFQLIALSRNKSICYPVQFTQESRNDGKEQSFLFFVSLCLSEKEVNLLSYPIHSITSQSREAARLFALCVVAPYRETSQSAILSNSLKNLAKPGRRKAFCSLRRCALARKRFIINLRVKSGQKGLKKSRNGVTKGAEILE
jgi:hypothetical protein